MSLHLRRRRSLIEEVTRPSWPARIQVGARRAAERLGPMAAGAREVSANRFMDAREWAAPRLERAAHSVEDSVAPRVSAFLAATAQRVEPPRASAGRRRWPLFLLIAGAVAGVAGLVIQRTNIAKRWTEAAQEKTDEAIDDAKGTVEKLADKDVPEQSGNRKVRLP